MKLLVFTISTFLSFAAFAGQHGSGGNICIPKNQNEYQSFDEVKFPELASSPSAPGSSVLTGASVGSIYGLHQLYEGDLLPLLPALSAKEKISAISEIDSRLADTFLRFYSLLQDVHVQTRIFTSYAEVGSGAKELCTPGTLAAALITRPTGTILVSSVLWKKLSLESQEVLYIHETLRLAQLFAPWFNISNDDLEKLTMLVYSGRVHEFKNHSFYQSFVRWNSSMLKLTAAQLRSFLTSKSALVSRALYAFDAAEAFKLSLKGMEYEYYLDILNGSGSGTQLSEMRMLKKDSRYIHLMVEDILEQFGNPGP